VWVRAEDALAPVAEADVVHRRVSPRPRRGAIAPFVRANDVGNVVADPAQRVQRDADS
jgi:hypothetical protein